MLLDHLPICPSCYLRNKTETNALYIWKWGHTNQIEICEPGRIKIDCNTIMGTKSNRRNHFVLRSQPSFGSSMICHFSSLPHFTRPPQMHSCHCPAQKIHAGCACINDPRRSTKRITRSLIGSDMVQIFKSEISYFSKEEFAPPDPGQLAPRSFVSRNKVTRW